MEVLPQILLLLALAVVVSAAFQRLRIPTSLGYLLVGIVLGPYTVGPVVELSLIQTLAEFAGPGLPVVLVGARGRRVETTLGELLPRAFSKRFL